MGGEFKKKFKNFFFQKHSKKGFTLLEMLVALFVLSILIVGVSGIYVYSLKVQKRTTKLNLVAQEVQFIMDNLSKRIRSGEIDYTYYGGSVSSPEDTLALIIGEQEYLYKEDEEKIVVCSYERSGSCSGYSPLSDPNLKVIDLKFYINPSSPPFAGASPLQPRVTIKLKVQGPQGEIVLQQSVPQRYSERR